MTAEIGKMCKLKTMRKTDNGIYLDGGDLGDILLPQSMISTDIEIGQEVEVFIYHDHLTRLTASFKKPKVAVGQYAYLRTTSVTDVGAFMDWGLQKDLFVPFAEQNVKFEETRSYLIHVYIDKITGRIVGTSKVNKYLRSESDEFKTGQEVFVLICNQTDIGYNVIINDQCWGVIHNTDILGKMQTGIKTTGYVTNVRDDKKIDVSLSRPGYKKVIELTDIIIDKIKGNGGSLGITDKSSSEEIYEMFRVSKKTFKKAIGALYKHKIILIEPDRITLCDCNHF